VSLLAFLRRELAPTPGRLRAALRIVVASLAAVVVTVLLGAGSFPHGHWTITTIFTVSQADAGASLRKSIQRVIGTVVGGGLGILVVIALADQPAVYVPVLGAVAFLGIFASQTTSAPYVMLLGTVTFVLVTFFPPGSSASAAIETGLWRVVAIVVGVICGTGAQLFLWPDDPETKLRGALAARLRSVATVLSSLAEPANRGAEVTPPVLAGSDLSAELDLLSNAEALHPSLRRRHTEQLALIVEIDRLLTTAVWLVNASRHWSAALDERVSRRFALLAAECSRLADALTAGRPPAPSAMPPLEATEGGAVAGLRPTLEDMTLALRRVRDALAFLDPAQPAVVPALDSPARTPLLTPGFSLKNREALAVAIKVALALEVAYVLMFALQWAALVTAGVTAVIVSQTSLGATIQKSLLRLGGAVLGGALGIIAIAAAMPNLTTVGELLVVAGLGFGLAAWIAVGSANISYVGMQAGMAFAMCVTDPAGPTTDLTVGRDRVIGILIGILSMMLINTTVWPVRARLAMWSPLGRAFRALAALARYAPEPREYASGLRHAVSLRSTVYSEIAATVRISTEATMEPDAAEAQPEREQLAALTVHAQAVFLSLLALIRHRAAPNFPGLPAPVEDGVHALTNGVGEIMDALADRLDGRPGHAPPDLTRRLHTLEALVAPDGETSTARDGAAGAGTAARDHVAIAVGLVEEVGLLEGEVGSALAVRTRLHAHAGSV
jgi:multidrug resistance protein MdtO